MISKKEETSKYFEEDTEEGSSKMASSKQKPATSNTSRKRKQPPAKPSQGVRKSARGEANANKPPPAQLLKFMLSKEAEDLCRPDDETKALKAAKTDSKFKGKEMVTYTSGVFSPFQELVCAVILSRPISHMLGLRTIRTLFNAPYELTTAEKMRDIGTEKLHQALWDAKTQHKAKTADQLSYLADLVMEYYTDADDEHGERLSKVLKQSDVDKALVDLAKVVKGLGPTGCNIFRRRVQWLWEASYPFVDSRSAKGLQVLGLPDEGEGLAGFIDEQWPDCVTDDIAGADDDEKKRRALVIVLERATSAQLEGKVDSLMEQASRR
jgi:hypothetical protein